MKTLPISNYKGQTQNKKSKNQSFTGVTEELANEIIQRIGRKAENLPELTNIIKNASTNKFFDVDLKSANESEVSIHVIERATKNILPHFHWTIKEKGSEIKYLKEAVEYAKMRENKLIEDNFSKTITRHTNIATYITKKIEFYKEEISKHVVKENK